MGLGAYRLGCKRNRKKQLKIRQFFFLVNFAKIYIKLYVLNLGTWIFVLGRIHTLTEMQKTEEQKDPEEKLITTKVKK